MEIDNKVYNAINDALKYSKMSKKVYFLICHNPEITGNHVEIVIMDKDIFHKHVPHNSKYNGMLQLGYCYDGQYKSLNYD
jgi:hypothetical protein